jgi:hypothetical protein
MSMARWLLYVQIASISHTKFMRDAHYSTSFLMLCCGYVLVEIGALEPSSLTSHRRY